MADILYIYNHVPFLEGIKDVSISNDEGYPHEIGYITKEEIENYIKIHHIQLHFDPNFKLYDARTWQI